MRFVCCAKLSGGKTDHDYRRTTPASGVTGIPQENRTGETPKDLDIHLIADNYATHKHPEVKAWLAKHSRFHMHFTPTSSSWLNLVERFFRDLTDQIVSGSFASVKELADKILTYLADRNQNPKRYVWNARGEEILRKIQRARNAMMQSQAAV